MDSPLLDPQVVILLVSISTVVLGGYRVYRRHLKRFPTYLDLPRASLTDGTRLYGRVTRVGDGDNFRFFHTPGGIRAGWGWFRQIPSKPSSLKNQTLLVRLCGVDAPERLHWGNPAQPFSEEALVWLRSYIGGRGVWITPYSIDQYKRVVARAQVLKWNGIRDVSAEMLRNGLGVVYEGKTGAEFGNGEDWYRRLEQKAKRKRIGIWSLGKKLETPGQYKKENYKS